MAVSLVPSHARWSFQAGQANLTQYQFCALNASGQLITPAAAGVFAVVLDDAPSLAASTLQSNDLQTGGYTVGSYYGTVVGPAIQKVISGGAIAAGVAVETDTNGHAVTSSTAGHVIMGWTLAACASGDLVSVLLSRAMHN